MDLLRDVKPSWTEATKVMAADVLGQLQDYVHKQGAHGTRPDTDIKAVTRRKKVMASVAENPS